MTIEEKAKAYDDALKRARAAINVAADKDLVKSVVATILPELRESEDERIRKYLIEELKAAKSVGELKFIIPQPTREECIVYLEKQKERGPLTKEEEYTLQRIIEYLEDETCPPEWISLLHDIYCLPYEKQKEQKPVDYDHEMWKNCEANFEGGKKEVIEHPERYGLQNLSEWSEEDKDYYDTIVRKLEVIDDDSGLSDNQIKFLREHCPSHCSKWNEEDKTIIEGACNALEIYGHTKLASRLKSLRPCPSWKPSEEQMKALEIAFRKDGDDKYRSTINSLYNDLKKL